MTETFSLDFEEEKGKKSVECYFKKTNKNPLYLLCLPEMGTYSLSEIKEERILNQIHKQYNFYIQPTKNNDKITIDGKGSLQMYAMLKTLDFYTADEIKLDFIMKNPRYTQNIRLDPNASKDLACEEVGKRIKRCIVPKSHFKNKKNEYYYIYHLNYMNKYTQYYEYSPIQVIIPIIIKIRDIDVKNPVKIGQKGVISFITEFQDSENIFNTLDIETSTNIKTTFSGNNKKYMADCHLWKPIEDTLRLICKFYDNINEQKIDLNEVRFVYKDYNITILSKKDLYINQLNSGISFLYSDKQIINIIDTTTEYKLVFKKEVYNGEPLILYKNNNNMKNIYLNCVIETKEIKCTISKDKLISILSKSGEKLYLSQLTVSEGILKFENVFDIIINYENIVRKDINLSITKLITQKVEKNNFIVFETNAPADLQNLITDYFTLTLNKNDEMNCLLKKNNNQNDDKLLLLCNAVIQENINLI